ncbi:peptidylprolyl isomerase [Microbulbifer hydrolyticus]|uniref:Peptidyl-prolyl cis-trans isomerase n=1 Tax=Microbulbifer hydrolyticus TaxID=48074 RepID=A0A6P1TC25_9GAMM|nr:peptidylprolyl isomerase [Microbulbifer hydrolyticus]MBB5209915.1 cyclophilin family peptidyl-prolyl cis-trans isomerase [Microbulbifer hydrolyticus]QHQ39547.1 peptidyl-prolyl cis-trans isomerase [Microbulbifer hydrolyticus]
MKLATKFNTLIATVLLCFSSVSLAIANNPRVELETDLGTIELVLYADKAPQTVENFLAYVDSGFYDGTIFHRVIPGFMAQGGGFTFDFQEKPTRDPVPNESDNGLSNERGTIAMARTNDPDSATAQFFINLVDNSRLDGSANKPGYTVFGKVLLGMSVVQQVAAEPRGQHKAFRDAPNTPVRILKARRKDGDTSSDMKTDSSAQSKTETGGTSQ